MRAFVIEVIEKCSPERVCPWGYVNSYIMISPVSREFESIRTMMAKELKRLDSSRRRRNFFRPLPCLRNDDQMPIIAKASHA